MPKYPIPQMLSIHGAAHSTASIEADFCAELAQIKAESIGWVPLGEGAYLHDDKATQVLVVGLAQGRGCGTVGWVRSGTMNLTDVGLFCGRWTPAPLGPSPVGLRPFSILALSSV